MKKTLSPILLSTIWISLSEFSRNEWLLKSYWTDHYESIGVKFPDASVNGAVWGIWSLCLAIAVYIFSKKYNLLATTFITWFVGFVMMWLVIGNLGVLPFNILYFAIPLSMLEAYIASLIVFKTSGKS